MKLKIIYFLLIQIGIILVSCKTNFKIQVYNFQSSFNTESSDEEEIRKQIAKSKIKSIILKNDSILEYFTRYGGLANIVTVKYRVIENELIIDSIDNRGRKIIELSNIHLIYTPDSLVDKKTHEKYYNEKYLDKINAK